MYIEGNKKSSLGKDDGCSINKALIESVNNDKSSSNNSIRDKKYFIVTCTDCDIDIPSILGLNYTEVFIHRNMGNIIGEKDVNFQFAIKYAIDNHKIKHFLIIGHHSCNSFKEAIYPKKGGQNNKWLKNIRQIAEMNRNLLYEPKKDNQSYERNFCEINVKEQMKRMGQLEVMQNYMEDGNKIYIVGLMLNGANGEMKEIQTIHS